MNNRFMTLAVFTGVGIYSGVRFFEPLVVDQLKKDGNLRTDVPVPQFDEKGQQIIQQDPTGPWKNLEGRLEAPASEKKDFPLTKNEEKKED